MEIKVLIPIEVAGDIEVLRGYEWDENKLLDVRNFLGEKSCVIIPELYHGGKIAKYLAADITSNIKTYAKAILEGYQVELIPEEKVREYYEGMIKAENFCELNGSSGSQFRQGWQSVKETLDLLGIKIEGVNA